MFSHFFVKNKENKENQTVELEKIFISTKKIFNTELKNHLKPSKTEKKEAGSILPTLENFHLDVIKIEKKYFADIAENNKNLVFKSAKLNNSDAETYTNIEEHNNMKNKIIQTTMGILYNTIINKIAHIRSSSESGVIKDNTVIEKLTSIAQKLNHIEPGICCSPRESKKHKRSYAILMESTSGEEGTTMISLSM
jgi:hypothetical protein